MSSSDKDNEQQPKVPVEGDKEDQEDREDPVEQVEQVEPVEQVDQPEPSQPNPQNQLCLVNQQNKPNQHWKSNQKSRNYHKNSYRPNQSNRYRKSYPGNQQFVSIYPHPPTQAIARNWNNFPPQMFPPPAFPIQQPYTSPPNYLHINLSTNPPDGLIQQHMSMPHPPLCQCPLTSNMGTIDNCYLYNEYLKTTEPFRPSDPFTGQPIISSQPEKETKGDMPRNPDEVLKALLNLLRNQKIMIEQQEREKQDGQPSTSDAPPRVTSSREDQMFVEIKDRLTGETHIVQTTSSHLNHHLGDNCAICKCTENIRVGEIIRLDTSSVALTRTGASSLLGFKIVNNIGHMGFSMKTLLIDGLKYVPCACGSHQKTPLFVLTIRGVFEAPGFLCPVLRTKNGEALRDPSDPFAHPNCPKFVAYPQFSDLFPGQDEVDFFVSQNDNDYIARNDPKSWIHPLIPPKSKLVFDFDGNNQTAHDRLKTENERLQYELERAKKHAKDNAIEVRRLKNNRNVNNGLLRYLLSSQKSLSYEARRRIRRQLGLPATEEQPVAGEEDGEDNLEDVSFVELEDADPIDPIDFMELVSDVSEATLTEENAQIDLEEDIKVVPAEENETLDQHVAVVDQSVAVVDQNLEVGDQNLEVGDQSLEVGDQNLEVGDQNLEVEDQNLEIGDQHLEVGDQNLEVVDQNLEVVDQNLEVADQNLPVVDQIVSVVDQNLAAAENIPELAPIPNAPVTNSSASENSRATSASPPTSFSLSSTAELAALTIESSSEVHQDTTSSPGASSSSASSSRFQWMPLGKYIPPEVITVSSNSQPSTPEPTQKWKGKKGEQFRRANKKEVLEFTNFNLY